MRFLLLFLLSFNVYAQAVYRWDNIADLTYPQTETILNQNDSSAFVPDKGTAIKFSRTKEDFPYGIQLKFTDTTKGGGAIKKEIVIAALPNDFENPYDKNYYCYFRPVASGQIRTIFFSTTGSRFNVDDCVIPSGQTVYINIRPYLKNGSGIRTKTLHGKFTITARSADQMTRTTEVLVSNPGSNAPPVTTQTVPQQQYKMANINSLPYDPFKKTPTTWNYITGPVDDGVAWPYEPQPNISPFMLQIYDDKNNTPKEVVISDRAFAYNYPLNNNPNCRFVGINASRKIYVKQFLFTTPNIDTDCYVNLGKRYWVSVRQYLDPSTPEVKTRSAINVRFELVAPLPDYELDSSAIPPVDAR